MCAFSYILVIIRLTNIWVKSNKKSPQNKKVLAKINRWFLPINTLEMWVHCMNHVHSLPGNEDSGKIIFQRFYIHGDSLYLCTSVDSPQNEVLVLSTSGFGAETMP